MTDHASIPAPYTNQPPRVESLGQTRHPDLVLACVCACTLVVMGLVAAINLAVPLLAASGLRPDSSELLWIVDAYVVVFACLVIPGGAAGDRFGRKEMLLAGLGLFAVGAALSAVAPTVPSLLAGRVITGLGAALVLPNCVGILVQVTAPERRVRALAIWATVSGMGGVVGNTAGAALLNGDSWRPLFAAVAPIALLCGLWVTLVAPRGARSARSLDPVGTVLFIAATLALLIGIIEGPERGWGDAAVISAFVASAVLAVVWVVAESRTAQPLLDPRLFRIPLLSSACLGMLVAFFGSFGLFYLNGSLLQYERGFSVLRTGIAIFPLAIPLLVVSRFVPGIVRRVGIPVTLAAAFLSLGVGLLGLASVVDRSYVAYAAWLVLIGIGFALALPSLTAEITSALPADRAGIAGGLQAATRELGSALGIAIVGTVLATSFAAHLPADLRALDPVPRTVAEAVSAAPASRAEVIDAFSTGSADALRVAGIVTLVAGAIVVTGATRIRRSSDRR